MTQPAGEPSLSSLFASLAEDTSSLVRKEVELGVSEMTAKAKAASAQAVWAAAGALVASVGLTALAAAAILALAMVLPAWAAALIVGGVLVLAGSVVALKAVASMRAIDPVPRLTVSTLREDSAWVKEQVG